MGGPFGPPKWGPKSFLKGREKFNFSKPVGKKKGGKPPQKIPLGEKNFFLRRNFSQGGRACGRAPKNAPFPPKIFKLSPTFLGGGGAPPSLSQKKKRGGGSFYNTRAERGRAFFLVT